MSTFEPRTHDGEGSEDSEFIRRPVRDPTNVYMTKRINPFHNRETPHSEYANIRDWCVEVKESQGRDEVSSRLSPGILRALWVTLPASGTSKHSSSRNSIHRVYKRDGKRVSCDCETTATSTALTRT